MSTSFVAHAEQKGFGFQYSVICTFNCANENLTKDRTCDHDPTPEQMFVHVVEIQAIACDGAVDKAKVRLGDFLISINGTKLYGMNFAQFSAFMQTESQKDENLWTIGRKTVFGSVDVRELKVIPAPFTDDFSCGKPDEDS